MILPYGHFWEAFSQKLNINLRVGRLYLTEQR